MQPSIRWKNIQLGLCLSVRPCSQRLRKYGPHTLHLFTVLIPCVWPCCHAWSWFKGRTPMILFSCGSWDQDSVCWSVCGLHWAPEFCVGWEQLPGSPEETRCWCQRKVPKQVDASHLSHPGLQHLWRWEMSLTSFPGDLFHLGL